MRKTRTMKQKAVLSGAMVNAPKRSFTMQRFDPDTGPMTRFICEDCKEVSNSPLYTPSICLKCGSGNITVTGHRRDILECVERTVH